MSTPFVLRGTPTTSTTLPTSQLLIEFICFDALVFSDPLRLRLRNVADRRGQASLGEFPRVCKALGVSTAWIEGSDQVLALLSFGSTLGGALSSEKLIVGQSVVHVGVR
jgi:hypothetical protein